ncbi:MAG: siroheme synthase CysG, partial [Bosea sp. (in: a-proteobacteria)]
LIERSWQPDDLIGMAIAIGDIEGEAEGLAFVAAARAAGVPVNVIDKPPLCDFAFGSIVNRSPLVIAISTDGAAPVFGQAIRAKIEAMLPQGLASWAQAAQKWRPSVQALGLSFQRRRRFWERFTERALSRPQEAPCMIEREELLLESELEQAKPETGHVTLVGAGPGDPELLTLKAVRALQAADVVLYDDLVSREVLEFARREARTMLVGKTGHGPACQQHEINALMISLARQGRRVVRLKSGDPMVFGRAGEEIAACDAAGIAVEVVPGITTAQGAAARLKRSLTHRDHAQRVQFVTGHARDGQLPGTLSMRDLADPKASTVVYMPRKTIADMAARMLAEGLGSETPVVAMVSATRAGEAKVEATLGTIADAVKKLPDKGPLIVMIGQAFAAASLQAAGEEALEPLALRA